MDISARVTKVEFFDETALDIAPGQIKLGAWRDLGGPMTYLDTYRQRRTASESTEVEVIDGVIDLWFYHLAPGLLCLNIQKDDAGEGSHASVELTAVQLRRLIAALQDKLGVLVDE